MNPETVLKMVAELAILKFFPTNNSDVLLALARLVSNMCHDESEVRWLIDQMTGGKYSEWPGPEAMRVEFCARFRPKDGFVRAKHSGGVEGNYSFQLEPTQQWPPRIEAAPLLALPEGTVSADPTLCAIVSVLAEAMPKMPRARIIEDEFTKLLRETITAPCDRKDKVQ